MCIETYHNAQRYLTLDEDGSDKRYKSAIHIPANTLLAVYTGSLGDTRPGRLQLFNHSCTPHNNAVCEEKHCPDTGLIAFFLRSKDAIPQM